MNHNQAPRLGLSKRVSTLEALRTMVRASDLIPPDVLAQMDNSQLPLHKAVVDEHLAQESQIHSSQPTYEADL